MDNVLCGELIALCNLRFASLAAVQHAALGQKLGPRGAVDRAVHSPAAEQRAVRGVHDRVNALLGYIAENSLQSFHSLTPRSR